VAVAYQKIARSPRRTRLVAAYTERPKIVPVNGFELPSAPDDQSGAVKAWAEPVALPTYLPGTPDLNPMFLENRVYQGSTGAVYPLPFIDRIAQEPEERLWQALHIENEYLRVMVLPEIGGRIHVGLDKTNGYDFFYRQNVIKPALVGLAGPWISGGVEFNWPQHHRPATFMPVEFAIEDHADGSRTIWCSDHDPMNRLKGMHGVCLHPGRAYIELKVRLYNRTPFTQTFLWWANVGVRVHDQYQSFFPPDVHFVADHARRAISTFPLCEGSYYGIDYGARRGRRVGDRAANDLRWYANIPVPTSYMALGSRYDFVGGYDHERRAGVIQIANHHIAPGKKQWTWGNAEFGRAWDRNLTDHDGPYIELMAGVYTDNQPDFSFLAPYETRTFSQYWYPIREIGPARMANLEGAISVDVKKGAARVGVAVSRPRKGAVVRLEENGKKLAQRKIDVAPDAPFVEEVKLPAGLKSGKLTVIVEDSNRGELMRSEPEPDTPRAPPASATEPPLPAEVASIDQLYWIGMHLEQYRHATQAPEDYWNEALRRDPGDSRCNNAMGRWHLRRGEFTEAENRFRAAIATITARNPNPYDGEPYYNLGITLRYLGKDSEAYNALYKATWNQAWRSPAFLALGELDACAKRWTSALEHVQRAVRTDADNLNARALAVAALRQLGRNQEATNLLNETLELDPLHSWSRYLANGTAPADEQMQLDLAFDLLRAGLKREAAQMLESGGKSPMIFYTLAYVTGSAAAYRKARKAPPDYCFPNRLEEMLVLESAMRYHPDDSRAPYYLGNFLYARRRYRDAIACWERSVRSDSSFAIVWRNLGIAYFNVLGRKKRAETAFDRAVALDPKDARLVYERDQLWKRIGRSPRRRLAELEKRLALVSRRDDLSVELAAIYNQTGQPLKAQKLFASRRFAPWEGGEGLVLGEYVRTQLSLAQRALATDDNTKAKRLLEAALAPPESLGEARYPLANQSNIYYWLGMACEPGAERREWFEKDAESRGDFQEMSVRAASEMTYYSALALKRLGRIKESRDMLRELKEYAVRLRSQTPRVDYFATSLPAMLLFHDDLALRNRITSLFLEAQARLGLGQKTQAKRLLKEVLALDRNHAMASDLWIEVQR
jgi:tetratricopeptide (TPR) repeat protein